MKCLILLTTIVSLALASPVALPDTGLDTALGKCSCRAPICPMELIAECKCKNAAAEACYEKWTAAGYDCGAKPKPQVCGTWTKHKCGGFAGFSCPARDEAGTKMTCYDDPSDDCDPLHGGADCMGLCVAERMPLPPTYEKEDS